MYIAKLRLLNHREITMKTKKLHSTGFMEAFDFTKLDFEDS